MLFDYVTTNNGESDVYPSMMHKYYKIIIRNLWVPPSKKVVTGGCILGSRYFVVGFCHPSGEVATRRCQAPAVSESINDDAVISD